MSLNIWQPVLPQWNNNCEANKDEMPDWTDFELEDLLEGMTNERKSRNLIAVEELETRENCLVET